MNVILLFEGTGNSPTENPSAISELRYAYEVDKRKHCRVLHSDVSEYTKRLIDDVRKQQVVNLVSGSGTRKLGWINLFTGGDWKEIVREQYEYLQHIIAALGGVSSVKDIDLYVFGFSRGAYQAKLFVNGISYFGIESDPDKFIDNIANLKKCGLSVRSDIPNIKYLGLIDTVSATTFAPICWNYVGVPLTVEYCRHALAINEYRGRYKPHILCNEGAVAKVEERWFIGCHSDVGWAYNCKKCLGPNQTYTKTFGKMVLSWILDPVRDKLYGLEGFCEEEDHIAWDFLGVFKDALFVIHDSYKEISNSFGMTRKRIAGKSKLLHFSAEGFYQLRNLKGIDKIPVSVRTLSWFSLLHKTRPKSLKNIIEKMFLLNGENAKGPYKPTKDAIGSIHWQIGTSTGSRIAEAYRILSSAGIVRHSWNAELQELQYMASCGEIVLDSVYTLNTSKTLAM